MAFGRMSEPVSAQPMSEINVTPLVDVMLVLIVIFILAAPLLASSIRLELPQARQGQPAPSGRSVVLSIDAGGKIYLDDAAVEQVVLPARLRQVAAEAPDAEVQLRADVAVPYGRVVQLVDAAQSAGLQRIAFATVPLASGADGALPAPPAR